MKLSQIKRMNLKDGDILFFPSEYYDKRSLNCISRALEDAFPKKAFLVVMSPDKAIQGIKVVGVKGGKV